MALTLKEYSAQRRDVLIALRAKVMQELAPLKERQLKLQAEIASLEPALRTANEDYKKAVARTNLFEIDTELAECERTLGARSLAAERG